MQIFNLVSVWLQIKRVILSIQTFVGQMQIKLVILSIQTFVGQHEHAVSGFHTILSTLSDN